MRIIKYKKFHVIFFYNPFKIDPLKITLNTEHRNGLHNS